MRGRTEEQFALLAALAATILQLLISGNDQNPSGAEKGN